MGLLDKLFNLYTKIVPESWVRDIVIFDELYLRRLFLTPRSWPIRVFVHHIRKSDDGYFLHDHPWDFTSIVLWGSYKERIPEDEGGERHHRWLGRHKYKAEDTHQVIVPEGKQAVTLCFVRPAKRVWGFHTDEGWVDWRTHLEMPEDTPVPPEDVVRAPTPKAAWLVR